MNCDRFHVKKTLYIVSCILRYPLLKQDREEEERGSARMCSTQETTLYSVITFIFTLALSLFTVQPTSIEVSLIIEEE